MKRLVLTCFWLLLTACGNGAMNAEADILFADEFATGETGQWLVEGDSIGQSVVQDGRLLIEINNPGVMQFVTLQEPAFSDFSLEVDAMQLGGAPDSSYGVLFRMQNPAQFYRFEITGNGLYLIERHNEDGSWTRLLEDWSPSSAIHQGLNVLNRLKIVATGAAFSFYVNDQLLQELSDASYPTGNIALDAGTFGQGGLRVALDNIVVRAP